MDMTTQQAEALVDRYLTLFMEGRISEAEALLMPGASLIFPGGAIQTSLSDVAEEVNRLYEKVGRPSRARGRRMSATRSSSQRRAISLG